MTVVGGYLLHLYCDNSDNHTAPYGVVHSVPMEFAGPTKRHCLKQAREGGWRIGRERQLCPLCSGKPNASSSAS